MIYTLPSGYAVTIDENGISEVSFQGSSVASGNVQLVDGSWFYKPFQSRPFIPAIPTKSVNGMIVTHTYAGALQATAVYTYEISDDEVKVNVLLTNQSTQPITNAAFKSPHFKFANRNAAKATSNQLGYDQSHTQNAGFNLSYPSANVRVACTYVKSVSATGVPINTSTWLGGNQFDHFMTLPYAGSGSGETMSLLNVFFKEVPGQGSQSFEFFYRFSASNDWQNLMEGYKDTLRNAVPFAYNTDARPVVQFASIHTSYVRPDNPYGYNDGGGGLKNRFDKATGCQDYVTRLVPSMQESRCQGIIFWQLQGINPRGVQYRPDFNVLNPDTLSNLPVLTNGFNNAGLKIGLLARPGVVVTSSTWSTDKLYRATDEKSQLSDLGLQLQWAKLNGFKGFYLDSFIGDGADHNILKYIRSQIGIEMQTFTEHPTALTLPLSGSYMELRFTNGVYVYPKHYAVLSWLYPEGLWLSSFIGSLPPGGYAALYDYEGQNRLTPLVKDQPMYNHDMTQIGPLASMVSQQIDSNNHWI